MNAVALNSDEIRFDLLNDIMFKIIFATEGNERLLCRLLNALLEYEGNDTIVELKIINPFVLPEQPVEKLAILDVRATDKSGKIFSIEVQNQRQKDLLQRVLFYMAKNFATQLKAGEAYGSLKKCLGLWILGQSLLDEPNIHNYYLFKNGKTIMF